jgi:hypothetical protein
VSETTSPISLASASKTRQLGLVVVLASGPPQFFNLLPARMGRLHLICWDCSSHLPNVDITVPTYLQNVYIFANLKSSSEYNAGTVP